MNVLSSVTLISFLGLVASSKEDVEKFFKHLEVIPDVISEGPTEFLKVCYDSGVCADKGVELTPTQVKNPPTVTWKVEPGAYYTLVLTDPDVPSRADPSFREFHHWLVVNIPGRNINGGQILTEYIGAGPPKDTGLHRYVFLLYKQPKKLKFDEKLIKNDSSVGRGNFSIKKFAEKYGLGTPKAGNFYQAQYDEYSKVVLAQVHFT